MKSNSSTRGRFALLVLAWLSLALQISAQDLRLLKVTRIWDDAPHNAFTSLIYHDGQFLCAFREGRDHVSPDGGIRIIGSFDGTTWDSRALIRYGGLDLRDPKLFVHQDGEIVLTAASVRLPGEPQRYQCFTWRSEDGRRWSEPRNLCEAGIWLWGLQKNREGQWYGVGYETRGERLVKLYESSPVWDFESLVPVLYDQNQPSEAAIAFDPSDKIHILLRCESGNAGAKLGISKPPYRHWEWKDLITRIGGPAMIRLPDGRFLAGGRVYQPAPRTALFWVDPEKGKMTECASLPSAGDNSYPGLVVRGNRLWVSYYSSHQGRASIYMAELRIPREE